MVVIGKEIMLKSVYFLINIYGIIFFLRLIFMSNHRKLFIVKLLFLVAFVFFAGFYVFMCAKKANATVKRDKGLTLYLPAKNKGYNYQFSSEFILKKVAEKKQIKVELTGETSQDLQRLQFIRQQARQLQFTHDMGTVLHVHFSKRCTYGEFESLADMMAEDQHKLYAILDNYFYIFGEPSGDSLKNGMVSL